MFIDLRDYTGPADIQADICIVGAGAAGITLALELDGTAARVCVLESGTFEYDAETQALARGEIVGLPYYDLMAARLRFLGGTTNHWAGTSRPLEPMDFERRDYLPYSGWPITRRMLDPYYERAHAYCRLGPYSYDTNFWATADAPAWPIDDGSFDTKIMLERPVRFGSAYRGRLRASQNVRVILAANATDFEANEDGLSIRRVQARSLSGKTLTVSAHVTVIATGAIENARLLLNSDSVHPGGLGNRHDLVGRFFMEHVLIPALEMQLASDDVDLSLYTGEIRDGLGVTGYLSFDSETFRREKMLQAVASLNIGGADQRIAKSLEGIASAIAIWNSLKEGRKPPDLGTHIGKLLSDMNRVLIYSYERSFNRSPDVASLVIQLEQAPNPDSRVILIDDRDQLGMRRVALDWQLTDFERESIQRFGELLGREVGRAGIGRVRILPQNEEGWWPGMRGSWHQMGTTRMHADPAQGVVDADCRVHGIDNLYVAGSSVFTTGGFANPTLTIVALAIRLADHLKGRLS